MRPCSRSSKLKLSDEFKEDRISGLPNDIIVYILSLLTLSEAVRTSVLSRHWEKLWTFYNGSLVFDTEFMNLPGSVVGDFRDREFREQETTYFINWVNQVLFSLAGSNTVDLTVRYGFREESRCHIDRWLEFALDRRIQRLELDMKSKLRPYTTYTIPIKFWTRVEQPHGGLDCISALTSLKLNNVGVSGEQVEYFLSNCPLLEHLSVISSKQLLSLKVVGTTLRLKHLEIIWCFELQSFEISAPNLLSFNYSGPRVKFLIKNISRLVKISIGLHSLNEVVSSLSTYFSLLETLHLNVDEEVSKKKKMKIMPKLELVKLKHLILSFVCEYDEIVDRWTFLIKASPLLQKLTIELMHTTRKNRKTAQKVVGCEYPHKCLKVVEMVGFTGCPTHAKLLMSIANSTALEKIIIDCREPFLIGSKHDNGTLGEDAKKYAVILKRKLPSGIDVIVV